ncbi:MAG: hypothetical protein K8T26_02455, partial [Lentisphaerae bacterium]|nr:hypothetical protein [Lentisphaerota bacterium]
MQHLVEQVRDPVPHTRNEAMELVEGVIQHYHQTLGGEDRRGLEYLEGQGLADPETLKTFRVGFVNGNLKQLLPSSAIEPLQRVGILNDTGEDHVIGCVVGPIIATDGTLGEMYGRSIEGSRDLYLPGPHRGVLNAKAAEVFEDIILTEAVLDALSLY